ncbi:sugar kinase [Arthrobacter castelli]|uniref:sugar kinase n=1 Tax=Arthrobacter castelli TaxID=271431 RepID=UPI0004079F95|nr:sugar kinase [Arthrobacter castelli]
MSLSDQDRSTTGAPGVICVGESMALVSPSDGQGLEHAAACTISFGGAESTVALYLAEMGHRAGWVSQVGDDPFGRRLLSTLNRHGVDTSHVRVIEEAPTGVYFKDPQPGATKVHYYRSGSAASKMSMAILEDLPLAEARLIHVSGITAALSESCCGLLTDIFARARRDGTMVSFDVNYRSGLWSVEQAAGVLADFARQADVVLVGRDEAEILWGTSSAESIAAFIDSGGTVVVKDDDVGATEIASGTTTFVPAETVDVVEPVGAGDAFAAGYLSALLRSDDPHTRLQHGHRLAARALGSYDDFVPETGR